MGTAQEQFQTSCRMAEGREKVCVPVAVKEEALQNAWPAPHQPKSLQQIAALRNAREVLFRAAVLAQDRPPQVTQKKKR